MLLKPGEKVHVITRRSFEGDVRRHFAGEVIASNEWSVRIKGYAFVFYPFRNEYVRRPDLQERIISLADACNVIHIVPQGVELGKLVYRPSEENRLVVTDNRSFHLDINEFSGIR